LWVLDLSAALGLGRVAPLEVAEQVFKVQLIPIGVGVLVRHWRPALAQRLARPLSVLAMVLLVAITLVVAIFVGQRFLEHLNGTAMLAIAVVVACSIAIGHLLGGPRPDTRIALALITATRNLGLALLLAKAILPEPLPAQAIILTYTLVSQVLHVPYLMWRKRVAARQAHPSPTMTTCSRGRRLPPPSHARAASARGREAIPALGLDMRSTVAISQPRAAG
jgi:predicted Na+-dependent transporter